MSIVVGVVVALGAFAALVFGGARIFASSGGGVIPSAGIAHAGSAFAAVFRRDVRACPVEVDRPGVGLHELAVACEELLGWDLQKTIGLLQGRSNTSTASTDELAALARRAGQRIATRELLEARTPDISKRLDEIDPPVAKELRQYLQFWGLRPIGPEAGCPTVADQPHLVADLIADLLSDDPRGSGSPNACIRCARTTYSSPISSRPASFGASPSKRGGDWSPWGSWGELRRR